MELRSHARRPASELDNLIVVAGHAIYVADGFERPDADESWLLADFQKGEPRFYLEHIQRGVELAAADPRALLVFSGGMTQRAAGRKSEGGGYLRLAEHFGWWGHADVAARATAEEYARDSYENLLFGICRFREIALSYPERVTVVSWSFKAARFELHRESLGFPRERFTFVGSGEPADLARARAGERRALEIVRDARALAEKRRARDPFLRDPPYERACPELAPLLRGDAASCAAPWTR